MFTGNRYVTRGTTKKLQELSGRCLGRRRSGGIWDQLIEYALQETIFQVDEFQVLGVGTLELERAGQILLSSNEESPGFLLLGAD